MKSKYNSSILCLNIVVIFLAACQVAPKATAPEPVKKTSSKTMDPSERMPSSYVSLYDCRAQKMLSAENEDEAKNFFMAYLNSGTLQSGSVKVHCQSPEQSRPSAAGASNICDTSVGTCFVNTAQPVGSPCGCAGYPGSIAPQK